MLNKSSRKIALAISIFWVLLFYFLTEPSETFRLFLLIGVLPVVGYWLIVWVRADSRRNSMKRGLFSRLTRKR